MSLANILLIYRAAVRPLLVYGLFLSTAQRIPPRIP